MMEAKATKTVIAKPVACKPSFSVSNISSKHVGSCPENAAAVIKPETVRLKPNCNGPSLPTFKSSFTSNVLYKPVPKLVSTAVNNLNKPREEQGLNPTSHSSHTSRLSNSLGSTKMYLDSDKVQTLVYDSKTLVHHDKHTWRKYGQKQVKGKDHPRSYYKCTYPNCTMRKRVERRVDGQLEESAYQGKHRRATQQPLPRRATATQDLSLSRSNAQGADDAVVTIHAGSSTSKKYVDLAGESEMEKGDGHGRGILDDPSNYSEEPKWNPADISNSVVDGDKFGWRKYGQNVTKKNPYSRSYYRCTNPKCKARKYVERSIDNPRTFITIYEGKHDHGITVKGTNWDLLRDNLPASDIGSVNEPNPILY